jgi:SAM-dependent methyltransferase
MIGGREQRKRVVENAYRLLRPGGKFILHVHNRWFNVWNREGRKWLLSDVLRTLSGHNAAGDRMMPVHQGIAGLGLHLFTRREVSRMLMGVGFHLVEVHPLSLHADGRLRFPAWFGWARAYGYLLAALKPAQAGG